MAAPASGGRRTHAARRTRDRVARRAAQGAAAVAHRGLHGARAAGAARRSGQACEWDARHRRDRSRRARHRRRRRGLHATARARRAGHRHRQGRARRTLERDLRYRRIAANRAASAALPNGTRLTLCTATAGYAGLLRGGRSVGATDQQIRAAYDALACGVIVQSSAGNVLYANRAAVRDELEAVLLQPPSGFQRIGPDGARITTNAMPTAVAQRTKQAQRGVVVGIARDDGRTRWWQIDVVPLLDDGGDVSDIVSSAADVTAQREAERSLREQALRDALTQLPNRALFLDRLEVAVATAVRERTPLALLLMDLDHFKEVNDSFGHAAGDELLRQVAARLGGAIRRSDSLGRLGGDEFAFVLPGADEVGAGLVAQSILETLKQPITVEDQPVEVGASIGIALFPRHGEDGDALLRPADIPMYTAKRTGAGAPTTDFEDLRDPPTPNPLTTVAELRHGIAAGDVTLMYH